MGFDDDHNGQSIQSYQCCPKAVEKNVRLPMLNREEVITKKGSCFAFPSKKSTIKDDTLHKLKTSSKGPIDKRNKKGNTDDDLGIIEADADWVKLISCIFFN